VSADRLWSGEPGRQNGTGRQISRGNSRMIDLYSLHTGPSHNVYKVMLLLEELEFAYRLVPVNVFEGEQFRPEFLRIAENNKVPAIVDHEPPDGGEPVAVFESGSIMVYLADKAGRFIPPVTDLRRRTPVMTWTFWQMAGVGPNLGQLFHFTAYAREKLPYAITRFSNELNRLFGVLDRRLAESPWVGGNDYSIADMISFAALHEFRLIGFDFGEFPHFVAWHERIKARPAYERAYLREDLQKSMPMPDVVGNFDEEKWNLLFGQTARTFATAGKR
jgi:GST-like protein